MSLSPQNKTTRKKAAKKKSGGRQKATRPPKGKPAIPTTIAHLRPHPDNPRAIERVSLVGLTFSMEEFGDLSGMVWNKRTGTLVTGHQRLKALQAKHGEDLKIRNGALQTPSGDRFRIRVVDWPPAKAMTAMVTANNQAITGDWTEALVQAIEQIQKAISEDDAIALRISQLRREVAVSQAEPTTNGQDDIPPIGSSRRCKAGDVWHLGDHRVLCGDATNPTDVARLFGDDRASVVFTDPPYGVSYRARSEKHEPIAGDNLRDDNLVTKLLQPALTLAGEYAEDQAAFYIWHASSTRDDFLYAMKAAGLIEHQYIIWAKPGAVHGYSHYRWAHEPCFYASKADQIPAFYGDRGNITVWDVVTKRSREASAMLDPGVVLMDGQGQEIYITSRLPKAKKIRKLRLEPKTKLLLDTTTDQDTVWQVGRDARPEHPNQKPVDLALRAIRNSSLVTQIIYDPFLGSGSTIIGAHELQRRCLGIEINPEHCERIVKRWEDHSGQKATRERHGST